jgi:hypothetical protein
MTTYRAIVSITFDDDDLQAMADNLGVEVERLRRDPGSTLNGCLDNLEFGGAWIEQLFADGEPTIMRLSGGIQVEVNPHEPA